MVWALAGCGASKNGADNRSTSINASNTRMWALLTPDTDRSKSFIISVISC
jgi:hypothetical protein